MVKKLVLALPFLLITLSSSALAVGGKQTINVLVRSDGPAMKVCFGTTDLLYPTKAVHCVDVKGNNLHWLSHSYTSHKTYWWGIGTSHLALLDKSCRMLGFIPKRMSNDVGRYFGARRRTAHANYRFIFSIKTTKGKPIISCKERAWDCACGL